MTATHTWTAELDCVASQGGLINVVRQVHWRCTATVGGLDLAEAGVAELGDPDPAAFVNAPEGVTSDVIRQWVGEGAAAGIEAGLEARLADLAAEIQHVVFSVPLGADGPTD